uniref:Uncharacterized protein n=1 Tax=Candidatus Kentrum sp. TUN TaxID=2126343 RepID=A0A450ZCQ3_9GAMM|nr:MAG: hypothetical protein BECKTUN1418D_GA0071000_100820 [Candidatus Kentron sp. TUN]
MSYGTRVISTEGRDLPPWKRFRTHKISPFGRDDIGGIADHSRNKDDRKYETVGKLCYKVDPTYYKVDPTCHEVDLLCDKVDELFHKVDRRRGKVDLLCEVVDIKIDRVDRLYDESDRI